MDFLKKANCILFFLIAILSVLYFLSSLLIPLTFGIFLAMLTVPLSNFLEKYKFNRVLSSLVSSLTLFIISGIFFYLLIYQITLFAEELPSIEEELHSTIERVQQEVSSITGMSFQEQRELINTETLWNIFEGIIGDLINGILVFTGSFLLVFAYVFLILLYRDKFIDFIITMHSTDTERDNAKDALHKIGKVIFHYLWGRLQVMLALAIMYYTAFLIFGLPYALLITLFGALITIIPYIGPLVSGVVPITFGLVFFDDFTHILIFTICIIVIQLIESYVFEPFFLGKEVKLNALTVLVAVLTGGVIWGVAGMILFVPVFATIKIISNHNEGLRPLALLLSK